MEHKKEIIENSKVGERYIRIRHPSGCTICLCPMEDYNSVYALFGVNYGSVDNILKSDGETNLITIPDGAAHYIEHKMFENADGNTFQKFSKTGANANAFTGFDKTAYLFSCTHKLEENLEILLDFVQKPYFTDENVEKERSIIEQEIRMYEDDPAHRVFYNCLDAVYHNNPVRTRIGGTSESIKKINKEILYRCYDVFYDLNNAVISIAGNFDCEKVLQICDRLLKKNSGHKAERVIPDEPYEVREKTISEKLPCSRPIFEIMYKLPPLSGREAAKAYVVYNALFSCCLGENTGFYSEMYEQELIDYMNVGVFHGRDFFTAAISGESKNPSIVKDKINGELKRLKTALPDKEVFEGIRKKIYGQIIGGLGSVEIRANSMMNSEMAGIGAFDYIDISAELCYDDIVDALKKLDVDNCSISTVEPVSSGA